MNTMPAPLRTFVSYLEVDGREVTAIARIWNPADIERHRLRDTYNISPEGLSLIQVEGRIPKAECAAFDIRNPTRPALRIVRPGVRPC